MVVLVKAVGQNKGNIPLPRRKTPQAAGLDFIIPQAFTLQPGEISKPMGTGWSIALDPGTVMLMTIRSSLGITGLRLANSVGVIDADYRGEIKIALHNASDKPYHSPGGERIAQGIIVPISLQDAVQVKELPTTERGAGGFGSTGR